MARRLVAILLCGIVLTPGQSHAQNGTWLASPGSGDFNTGSNWSTGTVPSGTAAFGGSNTTGVVVSAATTTLGALQFNAGAPAYSFSVANQLTVTGAGIVNTSSIQPRFTLDNSSSVLRFNNASTAGNAGIANNAGLTEFNNTSSAGTSSIVNNNNTVNFNGASTAGNATITNNSVLTFNGTSTAGNATINTPISSITVFQDNSSAGTSTIASGQTVFTGNATAGNATITTTGSTAFQQNSTGGLAAFITTFSGTVDMSQVTSGHIAAGSIDGPGNYFLGSNQLTVGGNNLSTAVDHLSEGGRSGQTGASLVKVGTGTMILRASSDYTGGTTILGGTLQIGEGSTFGSIKRDVLNNATLAFDRSDTRNYDDTISGSGVVKQIGTGTMVFGGTNTYTGGTVISAGTLQLGDGGATGSIVGDVANSGTLAINRSNTITLGGIISGSGEVRQLGAGTTILTGNNSYTGGTTISAGTLQIGNGGTTGSLQGNVVDDATLAVNRSDTILLAGAISGSGAFQQLGTGTTVLSGANSYSGPTTITAGRLAIIGSIAGNVTVGTAGSLGGNGTINGNVVNGGILAPDNPTGALTVTGTYVQNAGSAYQVQVSPTRSDRINIGGTATISGGMVNVVAGSGVYARNTTYTILNAAGGRTGTYTGVSSNLAFLTPTLTYDAQNVFLNLALAPGAFVAGSRTANQRSVGGVLDQAAVTASGDFSNVINALPSLGASQAPAAIDAISGQAYSGFATANLEGGLQFMNAVGQQIGFLHGGGGRVALAEACDGDAASGWGAWLAGIGGAGSVAGSNGAGTLTWNLGGTAVGADYRFDPRFLAGVSVGFSTGTQWVDGLDGRATSDNYNVALYGSFTEGALYVDALAGYGYSTNRLTRTIAIAGLATRTALGSTHADQFFGQLESGYKIALYAPADGALTPFARLQGATVTQVGFSESGADSLDLNVAQQTTNSLRSVFGIDFSGAIDAGWHDKLVVKLRLGWAHEYADTTRPMTASFAGAPGLGFTVLGATPPRDSAILGLAASTAIAAATSVYVRYDGEVGQGRDNHVFSAGLRLIW